MFLDRSLGRAGNAAKLKRGCRYYFDPMDKKINATSVGFINLEI